MFSSPICTRPSGHSIVNSKRVPHAHWCSPVVSTLDVADMTPSGLMLIVFFMGVPAVAGVVVEGQSCHGSGRPPMVQTDRSVSSPRATTALQTLRQQAPFSSLKACPQQGALQCEARGFFHSTNPSSLAAAIATAARLAARRISLRTAALAQGSVSCRFVMAPSLFFCPFAVDPNGSESFGRHVNDRV